MEPELFNLTPNGVTIVNGEGKLINLPSRGIAQCEVSTRVIQTVGGIPIASKKYSLPTGLPPASVDLDRLYIVTADVAEAVKAYRFDVLTLDEPTDAENTYSRLITV